MSYQRLTLTQLIAQAKSDIASHLTGSDPLLRRCVEGALGKASAGLAHGLHGHAMWLSKQLLPDVADYEWLVRWCSIRGITPTAAVKANLSVAITGTGTSWCPTLITDPMPTWTTNDGVTYVQDARVQLTAGDGTITCTASVAGVAGNQSMTSVLSLVSPVTGITSTGAVSGTNTVGFDVEAAASLLARYLLALRTPPKGGGPHDYEAWALAVSGVTRAWEYPRADGPGTTALYFVCDALSPIIPDAGVVATVQAALDVAAPVTADPTAYAPTGLTVDFALQLSPGGVGADTAAIRAAVVANLTELLLQKGAPLAYNYTTRTASVVPIYLAWIEDAIATATGVTNYLLTSPAATVTPSAVGTMPLMGTVTFS